MNNSNILITTFILLGSTLLSTKYVFLKNSITFSKQKGKNT